MRKRWNRLLAGSLALVLAGSLALPALAEEAPEAAPLAQPESAQPFSITVGSYIPGMRGSEKIQKGGTYTLIALPATLAEEGGDGNLSTLTPAELLAASDKVMFMGSAVAEDDGRAVFENVRLRTADAVTYYVTGPGLDAPLVETTSYSTSAYGSIRTDTAGDHSATITLVDAQTGYRYGNTFQADADGDYYLDDLAPGTYDLLVTKPGYLPYTRQAVVISDRATKFIDLCNLSSNPVSTTGSSPIPGQTLVGDVTNDGARNMEDLAALMVYYGRGDAVPDQITADLSGDGAVDKADTDLLINAATKFNDFTTGSNANVSGAALSVADSGGSATSALRYLSFSLGGSSTFSAAAFQLTFPADIVQPLNAKGGLISPSDGGTLANCLVPSAGVDARLTRWSVAGNTVTLTFALTADAPKAAGELARFYYRPVSGSTADFYDGVFALPHAVALVGRDTVITDTALTYPGCDDAAITSITIDAPASTTLTIPATDRTVVLSLTATGSDGSASYPALPGLVWTVEDEEGRAPLGVSIDRGLLTVTDAAKPGVLTITASRDGVFSAPLTLELENPLPTAHSIVIQKDGQSCCADTLGIAAGDAQPQLVYDAVVLDQQGNALADQPGVDWLLSGAPAGVSVADGTLAFDGSTPAGVYTFRLLAQAGSLQATVEFTLTVEAQLGSLLVSGAKSAVIPSLGSEPLSLVYAITAIDTQGRPLPLTDDLEPTFSVSPAGQGVDAARDPVSGQYMLTVSAQAQDGEYTLTAQLGDVSGSMTLTLQAPENKPVRAAMFYDDAPIQSAQFSLSAGEAWTIRFTAQLLDADDSPAVTQPASWTWSVSSAPAGVSISDLHQQGLLSLPKTLAVGSYTFDLMATDAGSGLAVTVPVTVKIIPVLSTLRLTAPESLAIPGRNSVQYTITANALDAQGQPMPLPEGLVWEVSGKDGSTPAGVSVDNGVLTLTAAAVPGEITLTVTSAFGDLMATATVLLTPAGTQTEPVLVLYRQITVDGKVVEQNAPAPAAPDAVNAKMGQSVVVTYSALLVDQATGKTTKPAAGEVKWLGAPDGVFTVDENAETGVYSAQVTAVCAGQSASAAASVSLYPNITGLLLDFGTGTTQPPYELAVPNRGSRYYSATLLAQVDHGGTVQLVPVSQLGLRDYSVELATALTGLYAELDKATGTMNFTVDPAAVQNPDKAPTDGSADIRFIMLYMDYFPGETFASARLPFYLKPETSTVTSAILRRGVGSGASFAFGTPKTDEVTVAATGTLSNCYALELLDQYASSVVGRQVIWELTVPDELMSGSTPLVTLIEPGSAVDAAYPSYVSIRRLRVAPGVTPGGPYRLILTATSEGLSCTIPILLTVEPTPDASKLDMSVSGLGAITIPMYYAQYNSATVNKNVSTATYTAILRTASGSELDLSAGYALSWRVVDSQGKAPTGVTVKPIANSASATVTVERTAQPTGAAENDKLQVIATLRDAQGNGLASSALPVELNRSSSVPTLMSIRKNDVNITSDTITMELTSTEKITRDYTFHLLDQYNVPASLKDCKAVSWTVSSNASSVGATLTTVKDAQGVPHARLTVQNPGKSVRQTVNITASITISEEKAPSGRQTISMTLPVTITIGNGGGGGGGGGSLGGGDTGDTGTSTPTTLSISGNSYLNTTQGKAASQTYSCILKDQNGKTCSPSQHDKVTWSASGITAGTGISFNTSTHVLSVPSTTPVGVYKIILTARYSLSVTTSTTITVNVASATGGTPTSIAITGTNSVTATQGTAVTKAWSATLRDASNTVVTVPQGSVVWSLSPLTNGALTVTFDSSTGTLTVPANAAVGTLNATLTATYGSLKATQNLTITVTAAQPTVSAPTIVPTLTVSGTSGSATLTAQQEKAITDSNVTNGVVTIAPTGATSLTSTTVTLSAATAKAMSGSKNQSLRVRTALGTVLIPAQALSSLANQGGSNVSVTITASGGAVSVTLACGYESSTLPSAIVLSAPTSGNVALTTDSSGVKHVVKKAVVKDGNVLTYLQGSAQLQLETRAPAFSDTQNHWARDAITFTAARELFQGTSASTFSPDSAMTRSMIVTVLHRLEDTPAASAASAFADVPSGTWYTDAVSWANAKGIVQGTGNGFKPNDSVTREQLAKILYEYTRSLGLSTSQRAALTSFSDQGKVSSWAKDAMQWAVSAGLINGKTGGVLDPTGNATRAEVSTILQRLITNVLAPSV